MKNQKENPLAVCPTGKLQSLAWSFERGWEINLVVRCLTKSDFAFMQDLLCICGAEECYVHSSGWSGELCESRVSQVQLGTQVSWQSHVSIARDKGVEISQHPLSWEKSLLNIDFIIDSTKTPDSLSFIFFLVFWASVFKLAKLKSEDQGVLNPPLVHGWLLLRSCWKHLPRCF